MNTTKTKMYLNKGSIIISTFQSRGSANKIAKDMISRKLCACVNIFKVDSFYYWNNKIRYDNEYLCFFKTISSAKLKKELKKIHPYEIPEIVEIKMDNIDKEYLEWLVSSVS
ncbi:MAG TPA: divalent-cation tolerance protein CutA [Nitrososphaeraceae archaeon]|jgi:periplasmic divalent cation tolerance protein|nr:divalent-cation tolerance protein CutA [Nitrososphaeraceae archaeon]